jgi:hypothetical protein
MQTTKRRFLALILIFIGIIAFIFGAWLLYGLIFGDSDSDLNLPGAGNDLNVNTRIVEPQTYEAPVVVEGDSSFDDTAVGADITEALNKASGAVSRIGSGTSQDGFMGYDDVMVDGTAKFQAYLASEKLRMQTEYSASGDLYGITTRSIASKVVEGENGSDQIIVEIQSQKAIDAGNRSIPIDVVYEKHQVTLLRQSSGEYLIDFIQMSLMD